MAYKSGINLFATARVEKHKQQDSKYVYIFSSLALLTLAIGGFVGMMIWENATKSKLDKVNQNIKAVNEEINSPQMLDVRQKLYELNGKANLIQGVVDIDVDLAQAIKDVQKEIPESVRLDKIELSSDRVITLKGVATDFTTVGKTMQNFIDSDNFVDFDVASINRVDEDSNLLSGVRFEFDLKYDVNSEAEDGGNTNEPETNFQTGEG